MSQSCCFWDKIGRAKSVGFRFYSAIGRNESRISSRYLEITSISLICSLTYSRNKELLSFVANFSSFSLAESPLHDLQIMVCSSTMSFNLVWLQKIFCSCVNETTLSPFCDRSCVKMADRFASRRYSFKKQTIKQTNSVIE